MTWTKLGDEFAHDARRLSDAAVRTHLDAVIWSNLHGLDLLVPVADLPRLAYSPEAGAAASELTAAGWWEDRGDHWYLAYRAEWQPTHEQVRERRERDAERKRRARGVAVMPDVARDGRRESAGTSARTSGVSPGRVGSGATHPPDPTTDQGQGQKRQHVTNSQNRRVRDVPDTGAGRAPRIPPGTSRSPATGGNARASTSRVTSAEAARMVECPRCRRGPGQSCQTPTGGSAQTHEARIRAARHPAPVP
jgi:hypothetical protein